MSSRLSQSAIETITNATKQLVNRMIRIRGTFHAAMGYDADHTMWNNSLPTLVRSAMDVIESHDAHVGSDVLNRSHWAQLPILLNDNQTYVVYFHASSTDAYVRFNHKNPVDVNQLGVDVDKLKEWLTREDYVNRAVHGTIETVVDLCDMASTAGQIIRMAPDIQKYLPASKQSAVEKQQTKSPFPREFTSYDRSWVRHMQDTLAHCYLLPAVSHVHHGDIQTPFFSGPSALRVTWQRKPKEELINQGLGARLWLPPNDRETVRFGHIPAT